MIIEESGMTFDHHNDDLYPIEKSDIYKGIGGGVRTVEIVLLKGGICMLIEAKKSSPRPGNKEEFDKFVKEIEEKFHHSFYLLMANLLKRHNLANFNKIPVNIRTIKKESIEFEFYLIINGHKDEWLPPIQDAIKPLLNSLFRCWNIKDTAIKVINEEIARRKNLIA